MYPTEALYLITISGNLMLVLMDRAGFVSYVEFKEIENEKHFFILSLMS